MKKILSKDFKKFSNFDAIFFVHYDLIVERANNIPLIKFSDGIKHFNENIIKVYLDSELLLVQVELTENNYFNLNENYEIKPAKIFLRETTEANVGRILRGLQWINWEQKYIYCSKCSCNLDLLVDTYEKKCTNCNLSFFPNLSPAVIVVITRKDEILLARSSHFKAGMYSAIAGFIDIGETAECAVHREVLEEVGIEITAVKYFGSQSWPFPNSFMFGFTAEYLDGELKIDKNEIEDAKWFKFNQLPDLPPLPSISRKLIDSVIFNFNSIK